MRHDADEVFTVLGDTFQDEGEPLDTSEEALADPSSFGWLRKSDEKYAFNPLDVEKFGISQASRLQLPAFSGFTQVHVVVASVASLSQAQQHSCVVT